MIEKEGVKFILLSRGFDLELKIYMKVATNGFSCKLVRKDSTNGIRSVMVSCPT